MFVARAELDRRLAGAWSELPEVVAQVGDLHLPRELPDAAGPEAQPVDVLAVAHVSACEQQDCGELVGLEEPAELEQSDPAIFDRVVEQGDRFRGVADGVGDSQKVLAVGSSLFVGLAGVRFERRAFQVGDSFLSHTSNLAQRR